MVWDTFPAFLGVERPRHGGKVAKENTLPLAFFKAFGVDFRMGSPGLGSVVRMGPPFRSHGHGHLEGVPQPDPERGDLLTMINHVS